MTDLEGIAFTTVETDMMDVLKDGELHAVDELRECLCNDTGTVVNAMRHVSNLRAKLRPKGLDVAAYVGAPGTRYRLVRLLANANNGKK